MCPVFRAWVLYRAKRTAVIRTEEPEYEEGMIPDLPKACICSLQQKYPNAELICLHRKCGAVTEHLRFATCRQNITPDLGVRQNSQHAPLMPRIDKNTMKRSGDMYISCRFHDLICKAALTQVVLLPTKAGIR